MVDQTVSMAALSKQSPVEPNDTLSPAMSAAAQKSSDVYCLGAAVGVVDQPVGIGAGTRQTHDEGVNDEFGVGVSTHRPADHATVAQVTDTGQVQFAFTGGELGDVGDPALVWPGGTKITFETVGSGSEIGAATTGQLTVDPLAHRRCDGCRGESCGSPRATGRR